MPPVVIGVLRSIPSLYGLQHPAQLDLIQVVIRCITNPLHQVECEHCKCVTRCGVCKAKYVKLPVVLGVLQRHRSLMNWLSHQRAAIRTIANVKAVDTATCMIFAHGMCMVSSRDCASRHRTCHHFAAAGDCWSAAMLYGNIHVSLACRNRSTIGVTDIASIAATSSDVWCPGDTDAPLAALTDVPCSASAAGWSADAATPRFRAW